MEAGYDWLLVRSHLRRHLLRLFGIVLVGVGGIFLAGSAAYYAYAQWAHAQLAELAEPPSAVVPSRVSQVQEFTLASVDQLAPSINSDLVQTTTLAQVLPSLRLYPGEMVPPRYWASPSAFEPPEAQQAALLEGFAPVDSKAIAPVGTLPRATRMQVPAIALDSAITELRILDLGDSRAYETPKRAVGHIPESAASGENGTGWYFGHLESPIKGEGAVFRALPEIPKLRRTGEDVFIILGTDGGIQYLYRVFDYKVIPQDDLVMNDLGGSTIALVTCVPALIYDHRLVVYGELVGMK